MSPKHIIACAVIGREDQILVIRQPDGRWTLPGARVEPDERVEEALDRAVREQLGTGLSSASFLSLAEEPDTLHVVFDVNTDTDHPGEDQRDHTWVRLNDLASLALHPAALRNALTLGDPPAWLPHHPR